MYSHVMFQAILCDQWYQNLKEVERTVYEVFPLLSVYVLYCQIIIKQSILLNDFVETILINKCILRISIA